MKCLSCVSARGISASRVKYSLTCHHPSLTKITDLSQECEISLWRFKRILKKKYLLKIHPLYSFCSCVNPLLIWDSCSFSKWRRLFYYSCQSRLKQSTKTSKLLSHYCPHCLAIKCLHISMLILRVKEGKGITEHVDIRVDPPLLLFFSLCLSVSNSICMFILHGSHNLT